MTTTRENLAPTPDESYLTMHETDPQTINAQITDGLERYGIHVFLNSFASKLPGGASRVMLESYGSFKCAESPNPLHSTRFFNTTYDEFFRDVDKELENVSKTPTKEHLQAWNKYLEAASKENEASSLEILLTYRALRIKGYSHYDLWQ